MELQYLQSGILIEIGKLKSPAHILRYEIFPHELRTFLHKVGYHVLLGSIAELTRLIKRLELHLFSVHIPIRRLNYYYLISN